MSVSFQDKTEVVAKGQDDSSIPIRPKIGLQLSRMAQMDSNRRVNVCGIVLAVSGAADRDVASTRVRHADTKQVADVKFIDDSGFCATLAAWEDRADYVKNLTGNFVAFYNFKLKHTKVQRSHLLKISVSSVSSRCLSRKRSRQLSKKNFSNFSH